VRYAASLLLKLAPLATYTAVERIAAIALSMWLLATAAWALKHKAASAQNGTLAAAGVAAPAMFLAPTDAGG
jgi:hypothetical protein